MDEILKWIFENIVAPVIMIGGFRSGCIAIWNIAMFFVNLIKKFLSYFFWF